MCSSTACCWIHEWNTGTNKWPSMPDASSTKNLTEILNGCIGGLWHGRPARVSLQTNTGGSPVPLLSGTSRWGIVQQIQPLLPRRVRLVGRVYEEVRLLHQLARRVAREAHVRAILVTVQQ